MKRTLTIALMLTGLCMALAVLSLGGCSSVAQALNIQNPRYTIRDVRPNLSMALPLSASAIDLDFTLGVDNPNNVALRLDRIDFDFLINENPVLRSVSRDQRIDIPANGYGDVRLSMRVGYNEIRSMWREVADLIQGNRARYQLRGNAYFNTPIGTMKFPVTVYSDGERR